jgi:hypothetical protein
MARLSGAAAGSPADQIMYGVAGERWLAEREVPWLGGTRELETVRIGNAAADQPSSMSSAK